MPLAGLPATGGGAVTLASALSVPVTALGLTLFRASRPETPEERSCCQLLCLRLLGAVAALLHYAGLALAAAPYAVGVSSDSEAKACALLRALLAPCCWAVERWLLQGREGSDGPPSLQGLLALVVWIATSLVAWAAPQPQDSVAAGMASQIGGCDGGFRTPFLVYVPIWTTGIFTGVLLLLLEEAGDREVWPLFVVAPRWLCGCSVQDVSAADAPRQLRRKLLPMVYAAAVSMAYYVLAAGVASGSSGNVVVAAGLLVVAVLCSWDWTWRMALTLGSWAPASQLCTTLGLIFQDHFVFRDLRWDPVSEEGLLVVWEAAGIPLFCIGCTALWMIFIIFVRADDSVEWGTGNETMSELFSGGSMSDRSADACKRFGAVPSAATRIAKLLVITCALTFVAGISLPLSRFTLHAPQAEWVKSHENKTTPVGGSSYTETSQRSYIQAIQYMYDKRLPLIGLGMVWTCVVTPTLQFLYTCVALWRPRCFPAHLQEAFRGEVISYAPYRFATPMGYLIFISIISFSQPEDGYMTMELMPGLYCFIAYSILSLFLATCLDVADKFADSAYDALPCSPNVDGECNGSFRNKSPLRKFTTMTAQAYGGGSWKSAIAIFALAAVATYVALNRPCFVFEYRVSGLNVKVVEPTLLELFRTLQGTSQAMGALAVATVVAAGLAWVPVVLLIILRRQSGSALPACLRASECVARPWAMSHVWAFAICFFYCCYTSRNNEMLEVCLKLPALPVGLSAILAMGCATFAMQLLFAQLCPKPTTVGVFPTIPRLPGGLPRWGVALATCGLFWFLLLQASGPPAPPVVTSLGDLNERLQLMLPLANAALVRRLPHTMGDCVAFRAREAAIGRLSDAGSCRGRHPLVESFSGGVQTTAMWAKGIDTFTLTSVRILPPPPGDRQRWVLDIDGKFDSIHLWLKMMLGQMEWINDYMCCEGPFRFTLQAWAVCEADVGFGSLHLNFSHLDKVKFKHQVSAITNANVHQWYRVDYGEVRQVHEALEHALQSGAGRFVVKPPAGQKQDVLALMGELLGEVVLLNTGYRCPRYF